MFCSSVVLNKLLGLYGMFIHFITSLQ